MDKNIRNRLQMSIHKFGESSTEDKNAKAVVDYIESLEKRIEKLESNTVKVKLTNSLGFMQIDKRKNKPTSI